MDTSITELADYLEAISALDGAILRGEAHPESDDGMWIQARIECILPPMTAPEVHRILCRWYNSRARAHVLAEWALAGVVDIETLAEPIEPTGIAEEGCGTPLLLFMWADLKAGGANPHDWTRLFRALGYVADDGSVRPTEPVTVYRGDGRGQWRAMSWTRNADCAHWFASGPTDTYETARVFRAVVPARHVLASCSQRDEAELILNPFALRGPQDRRGDPHVTCLGPPDADAAARWQEVIRSQNETALAAALGRSGPDWAE